MLALELARFALELARVAPVPHLVALAARSLDFLFCVPLSEYVCVQ